MRNTSNCKGAVRELVIGKFPLCRIYSNLTTDYLNYSQRLFAKVYEHLHLSTCAYLPPKANTLLGLRPSSGAESEESSHRRTCFLRKRCWQNQEPRLCHWLARPPEGQFLGMISAFVPALAHPLRGDYLFIPPATTSTRIFCSPNPLRHGCHNAGRENQQSLVFFAGRCLRQQLCRRLEVSEQRASQEGELCAKFPEPKDPFTKTARIYT